jgi:hypothetical protein
MPRKWQCYVHNENIARYQKLIAENECDPSRDEARYQCCGGHLPMNWQRTNSRRAEKLSPTPLLSM